jgi:hypothetical protein
MVSAPIGIVIILVVVGLVVLVGRPKNKGGNGDNRDNAIRYGPGFHG